MVTNKSNPCLWRRNKVLVNRFLSFHRYLSCGQQQNIIRIEILSILLNKIFDGILANLLRLPDINFLSTRHTDYYHMLCLFNCMSI